MKKIFRTLLAMIIAVIMSFAVFAVAGCDNSGNEGGNGTVTPGGDENGDGGNEGGEGDNGIVNYGKFGKLLNTQYKGVSVDIDVKEDSVTALDIAVKANLDGSADFSMKTPAYSNSTDGTGSVSYEYYYSFVRDWKVYLTEDGSETAITDFSAVELTGLFDMKEVVEKVLAMENVALPEDIVDTSALGDIVPVALGAVNYLVLSLGDAAGALTDANGVITVDANLMAYNVVKDVAEVVDGLTADTTVAQLLANPKLTKYLKVLTELAKPQDIVDLVKSVLESISSNENVPAEQKAMVDQIKAVIDACTPDEGSTTLEYIVKLLNHLELGTKKVSELLAQLDPELTVDGVKQTVTAYKNMVKADEIVAGEYTSVKNVKMVYSYTGDHVLTSQKLTAKIVDGDSTMDIEATVTYSAEKYTNLSTLPSTLPTVPEFDPEDWFGGNNKPPVPDDEIVVEEIGGHTYMAVRLDYAFDDENGFKENNPEGFEQLMALKDAYNSYFESGQMEMTVEFFPDGTTQQTSNGHVDGADGFWTYIEEDPFAVYWANTENKLTDPESCSVYYFNGRYLILSVAVEEGQEYGTHMVWYYTAIA